MVSKNKAIQTRSSGEEISRRKFLATSASAMALTMLSGALPGCGNSNKGIGKISLQLYTVREQLITNVAGTLKKVADAGFKNVETAFWPENISVKEAGRYLRDAGLNVCSSHIELPVGEDKKHAMLEVAETFKTKNMIWHGWPEDQRYKTRDGIKELTDIYNESNQFAKANGLNFGLHNHWWEFRNKVDDRFAYEILRDGLEKDIFFEIDTYWVKVAGHDPARIVGDFGKRARFLHIKDGEAIWNNEMASDTSSMVPAGKGSQDFPSIVKASNGNTEWMVVEMDRTKTDVFAAIRESYDYLIQNKLASA